MEAGCGHQRWQPGAVAPGGAAHDIHISDAQAHLEIDAIFLRDVISRTLAAERVTAAEISLAAVDDAAIHELNRRHLGHDEPTDVLSFLLDSRETPDGTSRTLDGEIVVSAETAVRRAAEFSWSPHDELVLYVVHGLLHLAGYDDLTAADKRLMRRRERAHLAPWGLVPRYRRSSGRSAAEGGVFRSHT
jgi:probable rRNA maturation factor